MKIEISENVLEKMQEIAKRPWVELKTKKGYEKFMWEETTFNIAPVITSLTKNALQKCNSRGRHFLSCFSREVYRVEDI